MRLTSTVCKLVCRPHLRHVVADVACARNSSNFGIWGPVIRWKWKVEWVCTRARITWVEYFVDVKLNDASKCWLQISYTSSHIRSEALSTGLMFVSIKLKMVSFGTTTGAKKIWQIEKRRRLRWWRKKFAKRKKLSFGIFFVRLLRFSFFTIFFSFGKQFFVWLQLQFGHVFTWLEVLFNARRIQRLLPRIVCSPL